MNKDVHERARELIALAGPEALSGQPSQDAWLAGHLETCDSCRAFAESAADAIQGLRAIPIAAQRSLVATTQMRVRHRALELQRHRERLWLVSVSCTAVTVCALLSAIATWRGFEWLGETSPVAFIGLAGGVPGFLRVARSGGSNTAAGPWHAV